MSNNNNKKSKIGVHPIYRVIYGIPKCVIISNENESQLRSEHMNDMNDSNEKNKKNWPKVCPMGSFSLLPNEVIALILKLLSLEDLSVMAITNKSICHFIVNYFIKSKTGFQSLLSDNCLATNSKTSEEQENRVNVFKSLGLLLKRSTCLYPTTERISLLTQTFNKMDGIPIPTLTANDSHNTRFIFKCYGRLVHKLIAGWDDCECVYVFEVLQSITHMEQRINTVLSSALGARQPIEYFIRCFYRNLFIDSIERTERLKERVFWLSLILKPYSLENCAKLLVIIFGPLISIAPTPGTLPYIGWWDLTDTFFIHNGLEELGFAIHLLYKHHSIKSVWNKRNVLLLFEAIIKLPEVWLQENIATLLFFSGDDITLQYLASKMLSGKFNEVAQCLVYLTLVTYKITEETYSILALIEKMGTKEQRKNLINEFPIAFSEAIADIDNLIELEDERDVTELHEMISAQSDLMRALMQKCFSISHTSDSNSQENNESTKIAVFVPSHEE